MADSIEAEIEKRLPCVKVETHIGFGKHARWAHDCPAYYRPAVAEFCRGLIKIEYPNLVRLHGALHVRVAELEQENAKWKFSANSKALRELQDENNLLKSQLAAERASREKAMEKAIKIVDGHELIGDNPFGPLWGVGWEHCRNSIKSKLQVAKAESERNNG